MAEAVSQSQTEAIGNQTGGRVKFFLQTDNFTRVYDLFIERGIEFVIEPSINDYGKVAVFKDLYCNLWDLIEKQSR